MDFDTTTRNENVRQLLCPIAQALIKGSGNTSVDLHRGLCVIDNVGCGFDLYRMDSGTFVRGLVTREPSKTYPKAVAFADNSRVIVGGSDHGLVYIFERKTGKLIRSLRHAKNGGVQTVAVSEHDWGRKTSLTPHNQTHDSNDDTVVIVSASSDSNTGAGPITIWKWDAKARTGKSTAITLLSVLELSIKCIIIGAAVAFFVGVIRERVGPFSRKLGDMI